MTAPQSEKIDPWEIRPLNGIGALRFGAAPSEVAQYNAAFGPVTRTTDEAAAAIPILALMNRDTEGDLMTELETDRRGVITEHRPIGAPIFRYRDGHLFEILLTADCVKAHLGGLHLMTEKRGAMIETLTKLNNGRRLLSGQYLFEKLGLLLHGFSAENDERIVNLTDSATINKWAKGYPNDPSP